MRWSLVRIHGRGPFDLQKKWCVSCSLLRDCSQVTSQLDLHSNPTHGDRQTHVKSCNHEGFDLFPTSDVRIPMKMTACYTSKWQNHQEHFTNLFYTFLVVSCYILLRKLALQPFTNSTDLQSIVPAMCSRSSGGAAENVPHIGQSNAQWWRIASLEKWKKSTITHRDSWTSRPVKA